MTGLDLEFELLYDICPFHLLIFSRLSKPKENLQFEVGYNRETNKLDGYDALMLLGAFYMLPDICAFIKWHFCILS